MAPGVSIVSGKLPVMYACAPASSRVADALALQPGELSTIKRTASPVLPNACRFPR